MFETHFWKVIIKFEKKIWSRIFLKRKSEFNNYLNSDELDEMKNVLNFENNLVQYDQSCLVEFKECGPNLQTNSKKINLKNQMKTNLKHCNCVSKFSSCLKKSFTIYSKKIGHFYFNILKPYCFHYQYTPKCNLYLFGVCLFHGGSKCYINLVNFS